MERRHLNYFLAVVEAGSISEAARRMHLSQPSVSQAVKELEREMRTPLFDRGRTLTLTPAGRALIGPARRTIRSFEGLRSAVEQVQRLTTGVLDIAVAPLLTVDPTVELTTEFRRAHPGVRVRLHDATAEAGGLDSLRRGDAELLIHSLAPALPSYRSFRLRSAPTFAVLPPGTDNLPDGPLDLKDLVGRVLVTGTVQSAMSRWLAAELAERDLPPLVSVVETAQRDTLIPLVLAGVGMAVLPEPEAQLAERLGAVVRGLQFEAPRACYLIHRNEPLSPAAQVFVAMSRQLLGATRARKDDDPVD